MLVMELLSNNRLPSINKYYYKPKVSPAFNDALFREKALGSLRDTFPEPMTEKYYECSTAPEDAFNTAIGVASSTATLYGTIGLTGICFLLIFYYMGKKNGPKFRTIEQKENLEAYGKEVIHRKLLHSLNLIAKQLAEANGNNKDVEMLFDNVRALDFASKGCVEVEDEDIGKTGRSGLVKGFLSFAVESNG
jgi:hypothetical protein